MTCLMEVPFDLDGNRIFVRVENSGSDPLKFFLDTGASFSIIDKELAEALGLEFGHIPSGIGTVDAANVQSLNIPGVNPACPWMEVKRLRTHEQLDGLIGGDILGRYIVEIDYEQKSLRFLDPQDAPSDGREPIGICINQGRAKIYLGSGSYQCRVLTNHPYVQAELIVSGSHSYCGKFLIDTATSASFVLSEAFTKQSGILQGVRKRIRNFCPLAAFGDGECLVARLKAVSIGDIGLKIASPLVNFYQEPMWEKCEPDQGYDGIIGGEVLRRFRISFAYVRDQMILEPNDDFDQPYEFDMSGTYLKPHEEGFALFKLIGPADSPAVEAGLREGDIIIAIDGEAHNNFTCDQLDQMFMEEGQEYLLKISRAGTIFETRIRTRRLI